MPSPRGARTPHGQRTVEGPTLTVTQVRSEIGAKPRTRGTLRALGLRHVGASNTLPDRPEIRGMLARVPHLVEVTIHAPGAPGASDTTSGDPS